MSSCEVRELLWCGGVFARYLTAVGDAFGLSWGHDASGLGFACAPSGDLTAPAHALTHHSVSKLYCARRPILDPVNGSQIRRRLTDYSIVRIAPIASSCGSKDAMVRIGVAFLNERSAAIMAMLPTKTLPSGAKIPSLGLGVFMSSPGAETYNAVLTALKLGYRHIDTAQVYRNEADVGRAVRDSGIPRDQIFVTSKVLLNHWTYNAVVATARHANELLGLGHIDLYLLHAPGSSSTRADAWRALEDMQTEGILRDIGVSNFGEPHLKKLAKTWRVKPAVNQIELHPWLARKDTVDYCKSRGIHLEAYSPLARATRMREPVLRQIAKEVNATPAQVLVAWSLAQGFISLPKSVKANRIQENLNGAAVQLSDDHFKALGSLDRYLVTCWDPIKEHTV